MQMIKRFFTCPLVFVWHWKSDHSNQKQFNQWFYKLYWPEIIVKLVRYVITLVEHLEFTLYPAMPSCNFCDWLKDVPSSVISLMFCSFASRVERREEQLPFLKAITESAFKVQSYFTLGFESLFGPYPHWPSLRYTPLSRSTPQEYSTF